MRKRMSDLIRLPTISIRGKKIVGRIVFGFFLLASIGMGAILGLLFVYMSDLPQVSELENYRPDVISEVYADDGQIIGSFAIERRVIVDYRRIPQVLQDAIISVEDQNFEKHIGVDFRRIISAAWTDLITWKKKEGASTLTQQLTRNLFLTPDKSFKRKFQEVLLSIQIERRYTKQQIMTLYVNQVYMGNGLYGFAAGHELLLCALQHQRLLTQVNSRFFWTQIIFFEALVWPVMAIRSGKEFNHEHSLDRRHRRAHRLFGLQPVRQTHRPEHHPG